MADARERLLGAAMEYVAEHGVSDLSLRGLAPALGTSHRMLIYHFGSKNGLLTAIVQAVEEGQRALFAGLAADLEADPAGFAHRYWRQLTDPEMRTRERLFFDVYVRALHGAPGTEALLGGGVEPWLELLTSWLERLGTPRTVARPRARLALAASRGLLLDLAATGDRAAVDAAMDAFIDLVKPVAGAPVPGPDHRRDQGCPGAG